MAYRVFTRTALLSTALFVTACTVGEIPTNSAMNSTDAGATTDGTASGNGCVDRLVPAGPAHDHNDVVGASNAGLSCVASSCHLKGSEGTGTNGNKAPTFVFGGTIYKPGGATASQGVVITIKAGGATATAYSDTAGNFDVMDDGTLPTPFPATVNISACPNISPMVETVSSSDCNAGGTCHGGSQGKMTIAD